MRRAVKRTVGVGIVGAVVFALWRAWRKRVPATPATDGVDWQPQPFPFPPVPRPSTQRHVHVPATVPAGGGPESEGTATGLAPWVEPLNGECPPSHPVKAKLASGIYHVPGASNYARTKPDRCYSDAAAAEADGLRPSKH